MRPGWYRVIAASLGAALLLVVAPAAPLDMRPRQHITIVGSSTIYPIVATAVEHFSRSSGYRSPVVESTGTGGGFKLFCVGIGLETPDIAMASRRMRSTEHEHCLAQGVDELVELPIGYDGIAVASAKEAPPFDLSLTDLYRALARDVPEPGGAQRLVANPYHRWNEVDPELPDLPIRVFGPPPTSGTRDLLAERVMERACGQAGFLASLRQGDENEYHLLCHALREDGAYIEAGENEARLVRKLIDDPGALGILGYNFLERNRDRLQAASIDGQRPAVETVRSGAYVLSRPLFLYVKLAHVGVVPGLMEFLRHLTTEGAWGEEGYLVNEGLVPLAASKREEWRGKLAGYGQN